MKFFGALQPLPDQIQLAPVRRDPMVGFFPEAVKHVNRLRELNGVNRAVCVPIVVLDNLHDAGASEACKNDRLAFLADGSPSRTGPLGSGSR